MSPQTFRPQDAPSTDEIEVHALYRQFLTPEVAILRAVAGMVPPGQSDLNPAVNAVQTLVAAKHDGRWRIALFQNTPAQFHGRPELAQQLTEELRQLL
jgi:uncharacterized protein (TIGR02246 family)